MAKHAGEIAGMIGSLYEAALDPALWGGLAPRLALAFDASSAVLKMHGGAGEFDLLEVTDNFAAAPRDQALADHWHRNDLWVQRSAALGPGRVVVGHELTPFAELEETGYYRDWLRLLSIRDMVGGVVRVGGGLGVLGIHRSANEAAFGARERDAAAVLLPHLERALKIRDRLSPVGRVAALTALEHSGLAVLVVAGARRRVVFLNHAAERLLASCGQLRVSGGRLRAADPVIEARLELAVARVLNVSGAAPPGAIAVPREGRGPLIVTAAPLPERIGGLAEPAALVLLRDPQEHRPGAALLRDAFGLTPAEAAVAAALCRGASLAQIAGELHVGLSTVRTHLKSAMLKTQTRRQAELVALLLGAGGG